MSNGDFRVRLGGHFDDENLPFYEDNPLYDQFAERWAQYLNKLIPRASNHPNLSSLIG